jgi:hypothetical protein
MKIDENLFVIYFRMIIILFLIYFHPSGEPEAPICCVIQGEA